MIEDNGASFSPCRKWRYDLWRIWDPSLQRVAFIGLNPSTADETANDPTVTRCINYAKTWGYGGMHMLNIFGYRATDPKDMKSVEDPVGIGNTGVVTAIARECELIICAWGTHGGYRGRGKSMYHMLRSMKDIHCLGTTKDGHPKHPLYLKKDLSPIPY